MRLTAVIFVMLAAAGWGSVVPRAAYRASLAGNWDVIDGEPAERGEFPWQAELKRDGKHICGAAIVSELWLVTAAHCLTSNLDPTAYQVILGDYDVTVEEGSEQRRNIAKMEFFSDPSGLSAHESLSEEENDIALIKLDQPALYTPYVKAIALPDPADDFTGAATVASGWGASGSTAVGPIFPDVLQKMPMTLLSDDVCLDSLVFFNFIPGPMSCAEPATGSSLCWGDSGGALTYYKSSNQPVLAAVTSWGVDCDLSKMPTVFVDVAYFAEWIVNVVGASAVEVE